MTTGGRPGLVEALAAGVVFGLFFVFLNAAGAGEGPSGPLWPLFASTAASFGPLAVVIALRRRPLRPLPGTLGTIVASGVLGSAGSVLFLLAAERGLLSLAAVLASLSPAATVLLARVFLHERLHLVQLGGLVAAISATALIATG